MKTEKTKILIVNEYHPDETFAAEVGKYLYRNSHPGIKVVRYRPTYNLRHFIEEFDPLVSIVLHADDQEFAAAIVYIAKSREEGRVVLKHVRNFVSRYWNGASMPQSLHEKVYYGRFLCHAKRSLIDLELNPEYLSLQEAAELTEDLAKYIINLTKKKKMKRIITGREYTKL